ncbi:MAG: ABC transporter ATP-binding protein [Betaproteobacteria bacterium]
MNQGGEHFVELARLTKRFGAEQAVREVTLAIRQGEFVTLLGPSGCGKTTTLRCIAGLERPDAGEIRIDGRVIASADRGIHLNPEKRDIGMVFQSYAVWPHMTVFDNVAFGLKVRRAGRSATKRLTFKALELVGMAHLAERYATNLSGGQRQRVALARAIAYEPKVILFDEPLSNLDAKLREQMRVELARLQREVGITSVYVTHDQAEALVMSDRVVVMARGAIQQIGDPRTIYARPANSFVAKFIGVANLLDGVLVARNGSACEVEVAVGAGNAPLRLRVTDGNGAMPGRPVYVSLRPEDISLHRRRPDHGPRINVIEGRMLDTVYLGSYLQCRVRIGQREIHVQIPSHEHVGTNDQVFLAFGSDHVLCLND